MKPRNEAHLLCADVIHIHKLAKLGILLSITAHHYSQLLWMSKTWRRHRSGKTALEGDVDCTKWERWSEVKLQFLRTGLQSTPCLIPTVSAYQ